MEDEINETNKDGLESTGADVDTSPKGGDNKDAGTKEVVFDELPDEIKKYIDRERTRASKTAREHALSDPQLRETIKTELEREAQMSAEEKLQAREKEIMKKSSELSAREYLMKNGNLFGDNLESALDFVVTTDKNETLARSEKYVQTLQKMVEVATDVKVKELLKAQPKPQRSGKTNKAFKDMSFDERLKLKQTDPSRYNTEMQKTKARI